MLSCKEVARLASDGLDEELSFGKRFGMRLHTLICPPCARYVRQLRQIHELVTHFPGEASPGRGLTHDARRRIARTLAEALAQRDPADR